MATCLSVVLGQWLAGAAKWFLAGCCTAPAGLYCVLVLGLCAEYVQMLDEGCVGMLQAGCAVLKSLLT